MTQFMLIFALQTVKKLQIVSRLELDDIWSAKVFNSVRILILLNDVTRTRKILICLPFF